MSDPDKEGSCIALSLVHMVGASDKEIHTVRLIGKALLHRDLADLFQKKADAYSQDLPGVQTFCLLAFYGDNDKEPQARHPFTVTGDLGLGDGSGLLTEPPTQNGLLQQMMRHTESMVQLTYRATAQVQDTLIRSNDSQARQIHDLQEENYRMLEVLKTYILDRENHRHDHEMKELEYQRSSAERQKWLALAPSLVNQILGKQIFPQNTEDSALIEAAAEHLSREDMQKLAAKLPQEIMLPLLKRFEGHVKKQRVTREESLRLMEGSDAEADAAGEA